MGVLNGQEESILSLIQLVTDHDLCPTKVRDESYMRHLKVDGVAYQTLLDSLVHLMWVVEEKVTKEMIGNKGCILHDGWTRFGRHYVALYAAYLITRKDLHNKDFEEHVVTMLACSTLPHNDDTCE